MKPWEFEETVKQLQKIRGEKTLKMGFELTEVALRLLIMGIHNRASSISKKELERQVELCVWG